MGLLKFANPRCFTVVERLCHEMRKGFMVGDTVVIGNEAINLLSKAERENAQCISSPGRNG